MAISLTTEHYHGDSSVIPSLLHIETGTCLALLTFYYKTKSV